MQERLSVVIVNVLAVESESNLIGLVVENGVEVSQESITEEVHVHARHGRGDSLNGHKADSIIFLEVGIWTHGDLDVTVDNEVEIFELIHNL